MPPPPPTTYLGVDKTRWGDNTGWIPVSSTICPPESSPDCTHYTPTSPESISTLSHTLPVHLLIASYRDRLCPRTLHNAFDKAEHPTRLFIRVIEQRQKGSDLLDDAGCWDRYCKEYNKGCEAYKGNVFVYYVDSGTSKGPTDARSKLSSLILHDYLNPTTPLLAPVSPTDYCMQTDSHMDFSPSFDTSLIEMHHRTKNDYAVLSTYVSPIEDNGKDSKEVPLLCMVTFTSTIRNWGTKACKNLEVPKLTNSLWGAGLSFHRCHAELNVPYDPYLDNVFDGEEGSRGVRFFTFGYDVYAPDKVLVTHDYKGHQGNPVVHSWGRGASKKGGLRGEGMEDRVQDDKFMEDVNRVRDMVDVKGTERVNLLLGISERPGQPDVISKIRSSRYGLGNRRTLAQASEFMGIDFKNKNMVENKCGNLVWVPWEVPEGETDYGIGETLRRGLWEDEGSILSQPTVVVQPTPEHLYNQSFMMVVCLVAFIVIVVGMGKGRKSRRRKM